MNKRKAPQIVLRALEPTDIDRLFRWENDRSIWAISNTLIPFSRYILQKYLDNAHLDIYQTKQLRLMIDVLDEKKTPQTVGAIDLFDFDPFHLRAGVGILIADEKHRRQGIATESLKALIDYASNTLLLHQLYCNIGISNEASLRLFRNLGFRDVGVKRQWLKTSQGFEDEVLLQLIF
jgi:diamine N-acetyltransferase